MSASATVGTVVEQTLGQDGPRLLASLARLACDLDRAEDALQDAATRALVAWARDGIPDRPAAWLMTVGKRIVLDQLRRDRLVPMGDDLPEVEVDPAPADPWGIEDDRLRLLFVCCHPALAPEAQTALALKTLGGLSTPEIARAYLEAEAATAQRLVRAKRKIREARIPFEIPSREVWPERLATVLGVLYLIFNEGYLAASDRAGMRLDLAAEAIRLARLMVELLPDEAEARGLLALMVLTHARRGARLADGMIVPLPDQDRGLWDRGEIREGIALVTRALGESPPGPYRLQAAIAAVHAEASSPEATDWAEIHLLYHALLRLQPTPVIELNAAVAAGFAHGPELGLAWIERLEERGELAAYHLLFSSKANLLHRLGRLAEATEAFWQALALCRNPAERRYLEKKVTEIAQG